LFREKFKSISMKMLETQNYSSLLKHYFDLLKKLMFDKNIK